MSNDVGGVGPGTAECRSMARWLPPLETACTERLGTRWRWGWKMHSRVDTPVLPPYEARRTWKVSQRTRLQPCAYKVFAVWVTMWNRECTGMSRLRHCLLARSALCPWQWSRAGWVGSLLQLCGCEGEHFRWPCPVLALICEFTLPLLEGRVSQGTERKTPRTRGLITMERPRRLKAPPRVKGR